MYTAMLQTQQAAGSDIKKAKGDIRDYLKKMEGHRELSVTLERAFRRRRSQPSKRSFSP